MEQDFSSNFSCEEEQASGEAYNADITELKSSMSAENEFQSPGGKNAESNSLQKGDGDSFVEDVLNKLLNNLQISEKFEETELKTVQNIFQKINSDHTSILKPRFQRSDAKPCQDNNTVELNNKINTGMEQNHQTQILEGSNEETDDHKASLDYQDKEHSLYDHSQQGIDQAVDWSHSVAFESIDSSVEKQCHGSITSFVDEQRPMSSTNEDSPKDEIHTEDPVKSAPPEDEKLSVNQENYLGHGFQRDTVHQIPSKICFESASVIMFDLPTPSQNEELNKAAIPPPILLIPGIDSIKENSVSKPKCVEVCLKEVSPLLTCQSCYALPITSLTVHMCKKGHQVCGHCFGAGYRVCPACTKPLIGRNACVERFLERFCQLFPHLFVTDSIKMTHSHRPIECPHLRCERVVASNTGLINHFRFEHPSVQLYCFHYSESPKELFLPTRCQGDLVTRVIALLDVAVGDTDEKGRDSVICLLMSCSVANYTMIAVWCAALYEGNPPLAYRLQANTSTGGELAITGDVVSLHSSQHVWQVLDNSPCLMLSIDDFNRQCVFNSHRQMSVSVSFILSQ